MGTVKALLPWGEESLITYQINQLKNIGIGKIIVVTGYKSERITEAIKRYGVHIVWNDRFDEGKCSSIRKGVKAIRGNPKGILISTVDQPVSHVTLSLIVDQFNKTNPSIIVPLYQQKRGHPVLFHGSLRQELLNVNEETKGLRNILQKFSHQISYLDVNDPDILFNFNTPADYLPQTTKAKGES
ncbi:nucleotidyltransferase family protein [Salicibibacter cibi]|nr:nucleotidyltransferase family protein [Salicibibacter cibi]